MATVGEILVKVGADIAGLSAGLTQADAQLKHFQSKIEGVGNQMAEACKVFTAASAAIGVAIGASVTRAADFEQKLVDIKAVTGVTGEQLDQLRHLALKMGADTKFSAVEAAVGMEELLKAGVSLQDVMGTGLKGALQLAVAGEVELGEAAAIAATALNTFRRDGLQMTDVANIMAGAANASATSVRELQMGLSRAAAVASATGLTFQDTMLP